mmetsp:Transcript_50378/g.100199  ORF Transcript_50378/g.100199 Transcript_50378/m.100199 type:complete len:83 (-) Transcript_50378:433-681(-)
MIDHVDDVVRYLIATPRAWLDGVCIVSLPIENPREVDDWQSPLSGLGSDDSVQASNTYTGDDLSTPLMSLKTRVVDGAHKHG